MDALIVATAWAVFIALAAALLVLKVRTQDVSLEKLLNRQEDFSRFAFGPGMRTKGICNHIRKELDEIEAKPDDLEEWVDVLLLALDGYWRAGGKSPEIYRALYAKLEKNEKRNWPDWRTLSENDPIEHDKHNYTSRI